MKWFVLKAFPYVADGIHAKQLKPGAVEEIDDTLAPGLEAAKLIRPPTDAELASVTPSVPEVQDTEKSPPPPVARIDRLSLAALQARARDSDLVFAEDATRAELIALLTAPAKTPTAADEALQLALAELRKDARGAPNIEAGGTKDEPKWRVTHPWAQVVAISKEMLAAAPACVVNADGILTIAVENGKAVYAFKGSMPDAEIYVLEDGSTYEAAKAV